MHGALPPPPLLPPPPPRLLGAARCPRRCRCWRTRSVARHAVAPLCSMMPRLFAPLVHPHNSPVHFYGAPSRLACPTPLCSMMSRLFTPEIAAFYEMFYAGGSHELMRIQSDCAVLGLFRV